MMDEHARGGGAKRFLAIAAALLALGGVDAGKSLAATTPDCVPTSGGGNLCVLEPTNPSALEVQGASSLSVARNLVVDSSSASAATTSGGSTVVAGAIGGPGGFSGSFSPTPVSVPAQPDPFAGSSVAHGACSGGTSLTVNSGTQSATAGTYSTLAAGGTGTLHLGPGVYTVTTAFTNLSTGTIDGTGVTIYLCPGAALNLSGSSTTTLSSPTGPAGFVIFDDSAGPFTTVGVTANLVGAVYARAATLDLQNLSVQGDVVASSVLVQSQGNVTITSAPNTTSIATQLSAGTVTVGGSVGDTATLSGATSDAGGTVTYTVYTNDTCTAGARDAGTKTVTGGIVPPSNTLVFGTTGDFYWQAVYSGDARNAGASSACTSEHLVVKPATPLLTTTASGPVTVGGAIHDTATLSGGFAPLTGSITFDLYDSTCTSKLASLAATATVSGAGTYVSADFTPSGAGTYKWVAHYSGDAVNAKVDTACGADGETSTVTAPPSGGGGGGGGSTPAPSTPASTPATQPTAPVVPTTLPPAPKPKPKPKAKPAPKPFKPPKVKPTRTKPVCYRVSAGPTTLTAGKPGTLRLRVSGKGKPVAGVAVQVKGPGILTLSGRTNSAGKVSLRLHPKRPGLLTLHTPAHATCSTAHVGVTSAFTPPITG